MISFVVPFEHGREMIGYMLGQLVIGVSGWIIGLRFVGAIAQVRPHMALRVIKALKRRIVLYGVLCVIFLTLTPWTLVVLSLKEPNDSSSWMSLFMRTIPTATILAIGWALFLTLYTQRQLRKRQASVP